MKHDDEICQAYSVTNNSTANTPEEPQIYYICYPPTSPLPRKDLAHNIIRFNNYLGWNESLDAEEAVDKAEEARQNPEAIPSMVEALIRFHKAGIYPPQYVMDWFVNGLEQMLESGEPRQLGHYLGLVGPVGRSANRLKFAQTQTNKEKIGAEMQRFMRTFGLSRNDVTDLYAEIFARDDVKQRDRVRLGLSSDKAYSKDYFNKCINLYVHAEPPFSSEDLIKSFKNFEEAGAAIRLYNYPADPFIRLKGKYPKIATYLTKANSRGGIQYQLQHLLE